MDELRMIDESEGSHPPIWWVITPEGERCLCYVHMSNEWTNNTHEWIATAWNEGGVREQYSENEWKTARLEGLVEPVRPEEPIQHVILKSIEEEIITPRCGLTLYRETLTEEQAVPAGGSHE